MKKIVTIILLCILPVAYSQQKTYEKTSYKEVTSKLDPNGDFYIYMSTESIIKSLNGLVDKGVELMSEVKKQEPGKAKEIDLAVNLIKKIYTQSGVTQLSGFGLSSIKLSENNYKTTAVIHHYKAPKSGVFWRLAGSKDCIMDGIKMMPEDTAVAYYGEMNVNLGFKWIKHLVNSTDNKQVIEEFNGGLEQMKQIVDIEKLLASLDGEMGLIVTLNKNKFLELPTPDLGTIKIPEPAFSLMIKLKDNTLPDFMNQMITAQKMPVQKSTYNQYEINTIPVPVPKDVPMDFRPSFAKVGSYLILSSTPDALKDIIKAKMGKAKNLSQSAKFMQLQTGLQLKGSQFQYMAPDVMKIYGDIIEKASESSDVPKGALPFIKSFYGLEKEVFAIAVAEVDDEGIVVHSRSNSSGGMTLLATAAIPVVGVSAALLLPVLAKARSRARGPIGIDKVGPAVDKEEVF